MSNGSRIARTPTPDQLAKAEARRAQFRTLAQQISELTEDRRRAIADSMGAVVTIEGRALSVHNTCLLAVQCPTVTMVGGFRQWLTAGRGVRKGEHGLMIWAPRHQAEPEPGTGPEPGEQSSPSPSYIMVTVFDVSQTEPTTARLAVAS